jgi:hypothetical protein
MGQNAFLPVYFLFNGLSLMKMEEITVKKADTAEKRKAVCSAFS